MADDIVAFISARLDETEAHARKDLHLIAQATPVERWTTSYGYNLPFSLMGEAGSIARFVSSRGELADGERDLHAADAMLVGRLVRRAERHAHQALREVEAKRAILAAYLASDADGHVKLGTFESCSDSCPEQVLLEVLRLFAVAWSDHPDFRAEWRLS